MALHARLFTQNILRVSKLKKWSHKAQTIERNSEKSTIACCAQTTNATAEEDKLREAGVLHSDSWSQLPLSPQWSLQPICLDPLDPFLPACLPAVHQEGDLCPTPLPTRHLDTNRLEAREKSLAAALSLQEYLPMVVKSVSYTTDDIMAWSVERESHAYLSSVYENHRVTVLTKRYSGLQHETEAKSDVSQEKPLPLSGEADVSVLHTFRRHSICDSNPTRCHPLVRDCSMPQCGSLSGPAAVFCSPADASGLQYSSSGSGVSQGGRQGQMSAGKGSQGPNPDQLKAAETYFIETLPKFFKTRLDYQVYHPDIVFENNFWGENQVTVGINQYAVQLMKLRALTHLKYAHVHLEVVSSACLQEEGAVRIQWRVVGLSQLKALRFWKYTAWSYSKAFREDAEWIEGISVLHLNKDGLVTKHRIDRMTPSEEQLTKVPSMAGKLALLLGLSAPKPSLSDCSSLLCQR